MYDAKRKQGRSGFRRWADDTWLIFDLVLHFIGFWRDTRRLRPRVLCTNDTSRVYRRATILLGVFIRRRRAHCVHNVVMITATVTYRIPGNAGTVDMALSVLRSQVCVHYAMAVSDMVWRWRCSIGSLVFASPKRHVARRGLWWRFLLIKFESSSSSSYTRLLLKRRKSRVDNFRPLNFYCHDCCVCAIHARYGDTDNYGGGGFTWLQPRGWCT